MSIIVQITVGTGPEVWNMTKVDLSKLCSTVPVSATPVEHVEFVLKDANEYTVLKHLKELKNKHPNAAWHIAPEFVLWLGWLTFYDQEFRNDA